jgi:hypothetical protein
MGRDHLLVDRSLHNEQLNVTHEGLMLRALTRTCFLHLFFVSCLSPRLSQTFD